MAATGMGPGAGVPRALRVGPYRYGVVLALILASLTFQLAAPDRDWARLITIVLQGATLLAALEVSEVHGWILRAVRLAVVVAIVSSAGALIGFGELGPTAARIVTVLLVALAPIAIVRGVVIGIRAREGVTLHTMFGVLCIYLLLGSIFAFIYGITSDLESSSFFAQQGAADTQRNFLYFSFTTITTVGYGDFTAATSFGRSMAITEALIGQIYLVTVVAAIVGGLRGRS